MNKLLNDALRKPLNLLLLAALTGVGLLYLHTVSQERKHDAAARSYLTAALQDIASWEPETLRNHLAPEALAQVEAAQLAALVARYRKLGAFSRVEEVEFARLTAALSLLGGKELLGYSARVYFSEGSARLSAVLSAEGDGYRFYNFNLSSPETNPAP